MLVEHVGVGNFAGMLLPVRVFDGFGGYAFDVALAWVDEDGRQGLDIGLSFVFIAGVGFPEDVFLFERGFDGDGRVLCGTVPGARVCGGGVVTGMCGGVRRGSFMARFGSSPAQGTAFCRFPACSGGNGSLIDGQDAGGFGQQGIGLGQFAGNI